MAVLRLFIVFNIPYYYYGKLIYNIEMRGKNNENFLFKN